MSDEQQQASEQDSAIDATLGAAYDAAMKGETVEPTEEVAPPQQEDAPSADGSEGETDIDQASAPETEPAEGQPLEPPARWSAEDKAAFEALPREAQDLVLKRERDIEAHLTRRTQELADAKRTTESVQSILDDRRQALESGYGSVEQGLRELFQLSDYAARDPAGFVKWFAEQRGVPAVPASAETTSPESAQGGGDLDFFDPATARAFAQRVQQLEEQARASKEAQEAEMRAYHQSVAQEFRDEVGEDGQPAHPHFDAVRETMAHLISSGAARELSHAYEMAVWAHPDVRKQLLEDRAAAEEKQRIADAKKAAKEAAKAASSRSRLENVAGGASSKSTIEETMHAAYDRATGA